MRAGAELQVGAVVVDTVDPERAEGAVLLERELGVVPAVGARVVVVDDVRDPVLDVLHRPAGEHGEEAREGRHLVHEELRAEAAARGDGTTFSLLAGIFSDMAISQWKYVKFIELAWIVTTPVPGSYSPIAPFVSISIPVERGQRSFAAPCAAPRERLVHVAEGERALVGDVRPELLVDERARLRPAPRGSTTAGSTSYSTSIRSHASSAM